MSFCGVDFPVLAAALNVLREKNPNTDIEDLKPKDLLATCRSTFGAKFETEDNDAKLAEDLFEHMSDKYDMARHSRVHVVKEIKGARVVGKDIRFWASFVACAPVEDKPENYVTFSQVYPASALKQYLGRHLENFIEVYEKVNAKQKARARQYISSNPETRVFAKMLQASVSLDIKTVKVSGKKALVSMEDGDAWELPLAAAARIPQIAELVVAQLAK